MFDSFLFLTTRQHIEARGNLRGALLLHPRRDFPPAQGGGLRHRGGGLPGLRGVRLQEAIDGPSCLLILTVLLEDLYITS